MIVDATQLQPGESGVIVAFDGGRGITEKLSNMGIRPGKKITKVSSHFWRGPQTLMVDTMQFAIGFGMAKKILIDVQK